MGQFSFDQVDGYNAWSSRNRRCCGILLRRRRSPLSAANVICLTFMINNMDSKIKGKWDGMIVWMVSMTFYYLGSNVR
jgi:hypothetical protein